MPIHNIISEINKLPEHRIFGKIIAVRGLMAEVEGIEQNATPSCKCNIITHGGKKILSEVVAISREKTIIMPFSDISDVSVGSRVEITESSRYAYPCNEWMGRVINALGQPVDDKGILPKGNLAYDIKGQPVPAHERDLVGERIDLGVRAINSFITCCKGQRMGIFAGSGVGKSVLMSMLTKFSEADVKVIGLVGERGRELKEFIEKNLGEEGLKSAVIIAATSDESALMRRQAAYLTMTVAEYFRDQGKNVLCMMDSVTRFAHAQREIGLSAGEPPASRGYTPSVFTEMPKLLERSGPGNVKKSTGKVGNITGLFTVLVEGDDHNEPISDTVRGILDGHIIMDRKIAERGRYPAINVLRSVSRTMPDCNNDEENRLINKARNYLNIYEDMSEMIRLGAYRKGSDSETDKAISYFQPLEAFLSQRSNEKSDFKASFDGLKNIL